MSDDAITFEEIELTQVRGFSGAGPVIRDLSGGMNVVYGTNASGKTTLAKAIQTLLWPEEPSLKNASLRAVLRCGDVIWDADYRWGRSALQARNAPGAEPPALGPSQHRDRYYLGLQELVQTDDGKSFAQHIARESTGGFDVEAAAEQLEYELRSLNRLPLTGDVEDARDELAASRRRQSELKRDARKLERDLRPQLAEAKRADRKVEAIEAAIELREAERDLHHHRDRLEKFPDSIESVRGNEAEELADYLEELREAKEEVEDAQTAIDEQNAVLSDSPFSGDELTDGLLEEIKERSDALRELESSLDDARRRLEEARQRHRERRRRLSSDVDLDELPDIDAEVIEEVASLVRELLQLDARTEGIETVESLIGDVETPEGADEVRRGIEQLRGWLNDRGGLAEEKPDGESVGFARWAGAVSALVATAVAVLLAAVAHWIFAAVAGLVVVALSWWLAPLFRPRSDGDGGDRLAHYRRAFERLELDGPDEWSDEAVAGRLDELVDLEANATLADKKQPELKRLHQRKKAVDERREELETTRRELEQRAGVEIDSSPAQFWAFLQDVEKLQSAAGDAAELEGRLRSLEEDRDATLNRLDEQLAELGADGIDDATSARARVGDAEKKAREFERAENALDAAEDRHEKALRQVERTEERIDEIVRRLDLDEPDPAAADELCRQKSKFDEESEKKAKAEQKVDLHRSQLESRHAEFADELDELAVDELHGRLDEVRSTAAEREELQRKVDEIEESIRHAEKVSEVERKQAEYMTRRDELAARREDDYRSAVGEVVADFVGEQTRDRSRPAVFHHAGRLFEQITRGHYSLELNDDGEGPQFQARDNTSDGVRNLDELSSGTRLQLLMAVRVAFVDYAEPGPMVPIVFDETLANSDDHRVDAIIESIERVAAEGRQVFYLTAQYDEVRKWKRFADRRGVDCRLFDVSEETASPEMSVGDDWGDESVVPPGVSTTPPPEGRSHAEYGELLGVSGGIGPRTRIGEIHLWYVVEDTDRLYRLLNAGIETWGQLDAFSDRGGLDGLDVSREVLRAIAVRAEAVEAAVKARRVGLGRPVDRGVLEATDAVSDTFIDRVAEVCSEVDGDAERLLEAIDEDVSGFYTAKLEELEDYLIEKEYLDEREPLTRDEIWTRVLKAVDEAMADGIVDAAELAAVLSRVTGMRWSDSQIEATESVQ